jgi:hypothetical protein
MNAVMLGQTIGEHEPSFNRKNSDSAIPVCVAARGAVGRVVRPDEKPPLAVDALERIAEEWRPAVTPR